MSFDGLVMSAVKNELKQTIIGGRIEKIYQPRAYEIALVIHSGGGKHRLLISADARDARIHLTKTAKENPLTPPMFCMVLRKHLEGGRIIDIQQNGLERVLTVKVEAMDELGMLAEKLLFCEVMGKHSNIILTDPVQNTILDGINRYSYATSRHREVLPGRRYNPPPETGKLNPLEASEEQFRDAVWDPVEELSLEKILLNKFEGFSPQTCREIVYRSGADPGTSNQSIGELDLQRLWETFSSIGSNASSGCFKPVICYKNSQPEAFSAIELTHLNDFSCKTGSMIEVLDEYFTVKEQQEQLKQAAAELIKVVRNEIKKVQKKKAIHVETIRQAENAEMLKITGELITANIYQMTTGAASVELMNYYDPEARTLTIELDPRLSPAENAQWYFKRYGKTRNSLVVAEKYLAETTGELGYLESVLVAIEQADEIREVNEIKAELIKEEYIPQEKIQRGGKKTEPASEPAPVSFTGDQGCEILVGRNNRQNDYLTMKLAKPDDLWLHVKDVPGSHVVIRKPLSGGEIPETVLRKAAELAAYYSKARDSSKVAVDFTFRKNVRKPKGAKPGMVLYVNYKTIIVEPINPDR